MSGPRWVTARSRLITVTLTGGTAGTVLGALGAVAIVLGAGVDSAFWASTLGNVLGGTGALAGAAASVLALRSWWSVPD